MKLLTPVFLAFLLICPQAIAMKGIFWQPQLRDNQVSEAKWQSLMHSLRREGFDTLILQWTRYGDAFTHESESLALQQKAAAARSAGLRLIVGLYSDPDFFTRQKQPAAAQANYLNYLRTQDISQARSWLQKSGIEPDGWYISAEIDDLNWREDTSRQQMLKWLGDTRFGLAAVSDKPLYISSFFAGNMTPESFAGLNRQVKERGINVWVQDGSGVGKMNSAQRALYLDAAAGCQTATPASGIVYELFSINPGKTFSASPKTESVITALLAKKSSCHKDSLYFSLRYLPQALGTLDRR
ncbi:DUF4434 family protein [Dryocola clanedunensis]|uniref:DUF4434 family protein n=1 Tax=Cedecea sulfonylureivorans TaxID=3051154 RepID=UPI0019257509|nr:DUF4434 family protein [Cedecea sulfonylureivorans]